MGLYATHGAFDGSYSSFNRFRNVVAKAAGCSFPPHEDKLLDDQFWYWGDGRTAESDPGLAVLFSHSDCDGHFTVEECEMIASELEKLLPAIDQYGRGEGHIARCGGYRRVAERFIDGCREAASSGELLSFE